MTSRRNYSRRERVLVTLTALVIIGGGLYVYVVEPVLGAWLDVRAEASDAARELGELKSLVANRDVIESEFAEYAGSMTSGASEEELKVSLLEEVQQVAASTGLRVTSIKPLRLRSSGRLQRLGVEVHAKCAGHEFVRFLQALQEPGHLLRAEDINIVVGRDQPPLTVTCSLTKLVNLGATGTI